MTANKELKEFRIKHKMSQSGLSKWTGIPVCTIRNWEAGRRQLKPWILDIIKRIK